MDVRAVHAATVEAVEQARAGGGPAFLEFRTARYSVHNISQGGRMRDNRSEELLAEARERDPIERLANELARDGGWGPGGRAEVDEEVEREIEGAIGFARNSPRPRPETALDYMYARTYPDFPAPGWEH